MLDKLRTLNDLGKAVHARRKTCGMSASAIARKAGRSREILYRLERGEDVTASALLDLLRAMDMALNVVPAGLPTLEEMQERLADLDE